MKNPAPLVIEARNGMAVNVTLPPAGLAIFEGYGGTSQGIAVSARESADESSLVSRSLDQALLDRSSLVGFCSVALGSRLHVIQEVAQTSTADLAAIGL